MPFSRYQIRNEFSLADPELYKSADKDDPEALLEGVAMAGLVGVLRQLGDLAEFAAEIFHGLHEEVMVTAARGHGLLGRVQQLESDLPSIERAFLSQTSHSPFFSSSGIGWHPNLKTEQNLITRGDLPRFVMDSYEECRGPPRLFLLDKFDVAGAGACLKRYTDPSFYKVEASSYEMTTVEAQRNKKVRKTKKKGSQWKNGETPDVFQPSHVKLHQLLLEERVQNGASEPARRVKLKKRQIKLPFDTESGKGYMEKLLSSPPEDKLVHEVPVGSSPLSSPTISFDGPVLETQEVRIIDSPLPRENGSAYDSQSVDKMVMKEHMDTMPENIPVRSVLELPPTTNIELDVDGVYSMEEDVEEKHISVDNDCKADGYQSDDVASEAENYLDALATMESEIETDVELRANSDQCRKQETDSHANIEQLQSHFSDSRSASDDESSEIRKKLTSFSYSDTASISADNMSSRSIGSPQAFGYTEIPFRPRVSPNPGLVNSSEASDISSHKSATDPALPVAQGAIFKENTSKESDSSEMLSNHCVDVERTKEIEIVPEEIIDSPSKLADIHSLTINDPSSSSFVESPKYEIDNEDQNSNSTVVTGKLDICDPDVKADTWPLPKTQLTDELFESKSDPAEAAVIYTSEDETESNDRLAVSVDSEHKVETAAVCDHADDGNRNDNLPTLEEEKEPEFVNSETETVHLAVSVSDHVDSNESEGLSTFEDTKFEGRELESVDLETEATTFADPVPSAVGKNEDSNLSTMEEEGENGLVNQESEVIRSSNESFENMELSEQSVISPDLDKFPSSYSDPSNIKFLDSSHNSYPDNGNENDVDNPSAKEELTESSEQSVISPEIECSPSVVYDHSNMEDLTSIPTFPGTYGDEDENDVENPSANLKITQDERSLVTEKTDQNELQTDVSPDVDDQPVINIRNDHMNTQFVNSAPNDVSYQDMESSSLNQIDHIDELESASSTINHSVPLEEKVDQPHTQSLQLEAVDSQTHAGDMLSETYPVNHESYCIEHAEEFQNHGETMLELPQLSSNKVLTDVEYPSAPAFSGFNMLSQVSPINLKEMPPLPPLPPMQWRMGKLQDASLISRPDDDQHIINHFPPAFPQITSHPSLDRKENAGNDKSEINYHDTEDSSQPAFPQISSHPSLDEKENAVNDKSENDYQGTEGSSQPDFPQITSHPSLLRNENAVNDKSEDDYQDTEGSSQALPTKSSLHTEEDGGLVTSSEINVVKFTEQSVPQPSFYREQSKNVSTSEREIIWPSSTSALPPVDDERPNGIRPMKIQRPRTPLIDAVAAHDKSKLRKVSERPMPPTPKEVEKDNLLEQIRAKSFNLKPAVQTRPSIQGPSTNLRVAAILEKANAIRHAFAGSDDDEDDDDSWSDS